MYREYRSLFGYRLVGCDNYFEALMASGTTPKPHFVQHKYAKFARLLNDWLDERTSDNCFRAQA